ncbi:MAG: hypothetical protein DWQ36_06390 [Acidobacteria bacterium]|nr:MAG: hypothetical protein DWQ30_19395 [Acidobacteriota bacterium]REK09674.1 MAG: hypothetical protein DWQ36_06390 [Acidobacteriota bacterium]
MTEGSHQQVVIGLDFPLSRFEEREGEFFLLGEWAYLDGERVAQASSPAFSDAVASLPEVESASGFVIQAPRHVDNIRNIHLPAARFKVIDLPRSIAEQTKESPVQFYFRAEIDAQGQTRDVALYGEPAELSPEWLRLATLQRLVLDYHSTKRHPVDVFGQVHIAGSMKLVRSRVTLPQCCCGPLICS